MRHVLIQTDDPSSPAAHELIGRLDELMTGLYPAESNHLLPVEALRQPNVTFLTASVDGDVAGCGAFVNQGGEYAEIKRMFVLPEFRGLKLGRRILEELESLARTSGLGLARLETGIHQPEALLLYERAGYQRRGPFGDYSEDPLSIFMEKKL
jgi:putative acetyltransferase